MNDYISVFYGNNFLVHHGIKGQKWGVRRFQNEDGSLTDEGAKRYNISDLKKAYKADRKNEKEARKKYYDASDKILFGLLKDDFYVDKNIKTRYEEAVDKTKQSKYNLEFEKSKRKGKPTKALLKAHGEREYDRIYEHLLDSADMPPDRIHAKALKGKEKAIELLEKEFV